MDSPLSEELFDYARADTHFLLYIFDNMRNELIDRSDLSDPDKDKVADVLANSREVALQRYEHPVYDAEFGLGSSGWYKLISRTPAQYTPEQFAVFRAVHQWRDNVARAEDESPLFILPHHAVFSIARVMPADKAALFSIIQHVSPILRTRADELMGVIGQARAGASNAPDLVETLKMIEEKVEKIKYPEGRIAKPSRAAAPVTQSPGMLTPAPTIATLDTPPLRAPISTFWGSLGSNRSTIQQRPFSTSSVSLALPLPPLTAEVFSEGPGVGSAQETPQSERPEPTYIPKEERPAEDKRSDIFIVKQLGGKRKRGQVEAQEDDVEQSSGPVQETGEGAAADEIILEDDEAQRKKAAKEAKRLRKKERREQKALEQDAAPEEEEPAFDYTTAPSVLRAGEGDKDKRGKKKKDKRKSGGFNPYAKMTDAPKGLPRSQKESAGRSKTFTS
jgi:exosome complex exonuclease RRP6